MLVWLVVARVELSRFQPRGNEFREMSGMLPRKIPGVSRDTSSANPASNRAEFCAPTRGSCAMAIIFAKGFRAFPTKEATSRVQRVTESATMGFSLGMGQRIFRETWRKLRSLQLFPRRSASANFWNGKLVHFPAGSAELIPKYEGLVVVVPLDGQPANGGLRLLLLAKLMRRRVMGGREAARRSASYRILFSPGRRSPGSFYS